MSSNAASITKAEKDRLKAIISDTITLLCRNGLNAKFNKEFTVEGLIGITVDSDDLLLVSLKDTIKNPNAPAEESDQELSDGGQSVSSSHKKRKRKRQKSHDNDGSSDPKTPRNDAEYDQNSHGGYSGGDYDQFMLQDMKQDHDADLVHIVKQEPGLHHANSGVSIQQVPPTHMPPHMNPMMNPNMPVAPGGAPQIQMGDLNEQVELMPGSGVYIKRATFNQLQFIDKGSKLVRKLVREIFPDVHLLASSSCMGKGETSAGLDRHKVEVIKGYVGRALNINPVEADKLYRKIISLIAARERFDVKHGIDRPKKGQGFMMSD